ncbi:MAG: FAD-dependent oxidoreductase [Candidatus Babeliales bacterium]
MSIITLTPPALSDEHIHEKISCIRAHRERIFYVSLEKRNGKLICHNYGQGGAGLTFLFGCVEESIRQFEEYCATKGISKLHEIAVIGAGCYGLLTAITLERKGYNVHIVAKQTENLPSHKAAGFFFPRPRRTSLPHEKEIFAAYSLRSFLTYKQIIEHKHPFIYQGAQFLPGYFDHSMDPGLQPFIEKGLLAAPQPVTVSFGESKTYNLMQYQTLFIDATALMHELQNTVQQLGIPLYKKEITDFDECSAATIFNCSGLGTKQLTHDKRIIPVQGHLLMLKNQAPKEQRQYLINVKVTQTNKDGSQRDELIYYTPKQEGFLGITFIRNQAEPTANPHEFDRILERSRLFFSP